MIIEHNISPETLKMTKEINMGGKHLHIFQPFLQKETTSMTFYVLPRLKTNILVY